MKPSLNQFPDWNRPTNGRNQRQCRKCGHTKFEVFKAPRPRVPGKRFRFVCLNCGFDAEVRGVGR